MEVWIVQWDYAEDGETTVSVWTTERGALTHVCDSIGNTIDNNWDMDDPNMLQCAEAIDELIAKQKHREAIDKWNDFQANFNSEYAEYWNVFKQTLMSGDDEEDVITSAPPIKYKASTPGATCRGPCGNYSPDAYADKTNGTYVCRQCQIFQGIFSS